ncbi:hypothetical protein CRG98_031266, partial [Punica granatum]
VQFAEAEADFRGQSDQEPMVAGLGAEWALTGPESKKIPCPLAWEQQLGGYTLTLNVNCQPERGGVAKG